MTAERLKSTISPSEFYRVELPGMPAPRRQSGWVAGGLCPFHDDHRPTNFRVHLGTGAFTCFACGEKGADVIAFVQRRHSVSFPDALRMLSDAWGIRV
jgi:putative DNA primase/helicase